MKEIQDKGVTLYDLPQDEQKKWFKGFQDVTEKWVADLEAKGLAARPHVYIGDTADELDKAARVDGATRLQAFRHIIVPLAAPGVFTAAILVFMFAWNDFLFAIALTSTDNARTVPAAIAFFTGSSRFELPTGSIAAASVVVTAPIILMVLLFQRRIVTGLTSGAVKG